MIIRESVPLSELTTFKIGGVARYVISCMNDDDVREALHFAKDHMLPWYVFGGGSNILASDTGYEGVVIMLTASSCLFTEEGSGVLCVADAGMSWDTFVQTVTEKELWGVENLAGIPGTVGAAPVQNIGAYGIELQETLAWVDAITPATGALVRIQNAECGFGYRDSRFKHETLIIVRVALTLSKTPAPKLSYKDLAAQVAVGVPLSTPVEIAETVRSIRSKKFPDLAVLGTAGSFFKNPLISKEAFAVLKEQYPDMPAFPSGDKIKVPLAWILDHVLSLKGFGHGSVRLFEAQPLVIVAEAGACARDVEVVAQEVATQVFTATGITLEWEVRKFG